MSTLEDNAISWFSDDTLGLFPSNPVGHSLFLDFVSFYQTRFHDLMVNECSWNVRHFDSMPFCFVILFYFFSGVECFETEIYHHAVPLVAERMLYCSPDRHQTTHETVYSLLVDIFC